MNSVPSPLVWLSRQLAEPPQAPGALVSCQFCQEEIPLFVSNELAGQPVDELFPEIANHLDTCEQCLLEYEALSRLMIAALFGEEKHE